MTDLIITETEPSVVCVDFRTERPKETTVRVTYGAEWWGLVTTDSREAQHYTVTDQKSIQRQLYVVLSLTSPGLSVAHLPFWSSIEKVGVMPGFHSGPVPIPTLTTVTRFEVHWGWSPAPGDISLRYRGHWPRKVNASGRESRDVASQHCIRINRYIDLAVWLSGNTLASIDVVALRQTRLVLGWVTVCGQVNRLGM